MNLLLFDIDGTLIHSYGAGQVAADLAFEDIFDVKNVMSDIRTDGLTDPLILNMMFQKAFARDYSNREAEKFYERYLFYLNSELARAGNIEVLPGVLELLNYLTEKDKYLLGLGTGNIEKGAWIKLQYAGLKKYFTTGGFGSDAEKRDELIKAGINKAKETLDNGNKFCDIFVIGDTPLDIINGHAAGAKTIGVATGRYSREELDSYNPDILLDDLTQFLKLDI